MTRRAEELSPLDYFAFRDRLACDIRHGLVKPRAEELVKHATAAGDINVSVAAEWTERFLGGLARDVNRRPIRAPIG